MSITPRGMSIQEAYGLFRDGSLVVNRQYQRKLVWTEEEKRHLIDSIMKGFPIPLILLAERPRDEGIAKYEIIDGVQRLNAIFAFIENAFALGERYFDVAQFARAKLVADAGEFSPAVLFPLLTLRECADLLSYQLAVTIYPAPNEGEITEVFGRINSGGKQLSAQEKRQAGVITPFAELVRQLSAEIRGDPSKQILLLSEMPEISIGSRRARQGYGLTAEDTFWCKQGILWMSQLRDSEDEEMVADIAASILVDKPIARSKEFLDDLYDSGSENFEKVERALSSYTSTRLSEEIRVTFSVLRETIEIFSSEQNALRAVVSPDARNPIKTSFYAIYMAFFQLVVRQELSPTEPQSIMAALSDLQRGMQSSAHYATSEDRIKNVDKTVGLIQRFFVRKEPPVLRHGPGLAMDFENSLRRSSVETPRYEFKQGILRLSPKREMDEGLMSKIVETICGIANSGPYADGYLFMGVVDKKDDADRISVLDGIRPIQIGQRYVVGIDREADLLKENMDRYFNRIVEGIRSSRLSDPLKKQVLTQIDVVEYRGLSIIKITVPAQIAVSFVGEDAFAREGTQTIKVNGRGLIAIHGLFQRS